MCWRYKCCCFPFFSEYANKVFVWWLCWIFLCGVLACCIAGFVTANRFGFSLYGTQCAYERIYYDLMYGQLKETYPKWEGFQVIHNIQENLLKNFGTFNNQEKLNNFDNINEELPCNIYSPMPKVYDNQENIKINYGKNIHDRLDNLTNYIKDYNGEFMDQLSLLKTFTEQYSNNWNEYKTKVIPDFTYYVNVFLAMGKIVPIIYFSLLLTFVVYSGALIITYYCSKRNQQWWIIPMHIAWNGLRFFIFSFFVYGCFFGMLFLFSRDAIALLQYIFSKENLTSDNMIILPKNTREFFTTCLYNNKIYDSFRYENDNLNEFLKYYFKFKNWLNNNKEEDCESEYCRENIKKLRNEFNQNYKDRIRPEEIEDYFESIYKRDGNIYDNFNCSFIYNDINLMYRAMWDFSWESRILCALSCCIGFFGEIAVYALLWVMHFWNKDDNNEGQNYRQIKNQNTYIKKKIPAPKELENDDNDDNDSN